jgi:hypothetical protein
MALMGVQQLAAALGVAKGTVSKRASAGTIPVAERDKHGHPLFDLEAVRRVWGQNVNPLMRRAGADVAPSASSPTLELDDEAVDDEPDVDERRSPAQAPRAPSGLLQQQVVERRLRNRRLLRQLGEDEGLFVLKAVVENDVVTMARQTRDGVAAHMADFAGELYAFAAKPRTEGEWRIWLSEHTGRAFDEVEKALAAEKGDEFGDGSPADTSQPGVADAGAAP